LKQQPNEYAVLLPALLLVIALVAATLVLVWFAIANSLRGGE
jgi:hypothetical protein